MNVELPQLAGVSLSTVHWSALFPIEGVVVAAVGTGLVEQAYVRWGFFLVWPAMAANLGIGLPATIAHATIVNNTVPLGTTQSTIALILVALVVLVALLTSFVARPWADADKGPTHKESGLAYLAIWTTVAIMTVTTMSAMTG